MLECFMNICFESLEAPVLYHKNMLDIASLFEAAVILNVRIAGWNLTLVVMCIDES